jgi:hypothetical protein
MPPPDSRPAGIFQKLGDIQLDDFFEYILTVTFVGSDTLIRSIPIQADAHFIAVSSYMNSTAASGAGTFQGACVNRGGSLVLLTDGTQRNLSSAAVPANCLFGSAQRPYVWPLRKLFRANTPILFTVTDTTTAAQTVDYVIGGFKLNVERARRDFGII